MKRNAILRFALSRLNFSLLACCVLLGCGGAKNHTTGQNAPRSTVQQSSSGQDPYQYKDKKELPPQAMTAGEIASLDPSGKDCTNQTAWERLINNQITMRGLDGKNPEDLSLEDREFNASAHQILWSLRMNCSAIKRGN